MTSSKMDVDGMTEGSGVSVSSISEVGTAIGETSCAERDGVEEMKGIKILPGVSDGMLETEGRKILPVAGRVADTTDPRVADGVGEISGIIVPVGGCGLTDRDTDTVGDLDGVCYIIRIRILSVGDWLGAGEVGAPRLTEAVARGS